MTLIEKPRTAMGLRGEILSTEYGKETVFLFIAGVTMRAINS